jgi:ABC-type phosphate transport system substrate-binding protein
MERRVKPRNAAFVLALSIWVVPWNAALNPPAVAQKVDSLVMVANKSNASASNLNKSDAKRLLLGETTSWPNGRKVVVVLGTFGSANRNAVLQKVCGMSEAEYTRHNLQATFMGETVASVMEAPSAAVVRSYVKTNPGAVGFLRESEVDENVKAVWTVN